MDYATSPRFNLALRRALRAVATTCALSLGGVLIVGATSGCQGLCSDTVMSWEIAVEEGAELAIAPRAAAMDGDARGLIVGDGGTILHQAEDGSWADRSPEEDADLFGLALRGTRALAVGADGTILVSEDNGESWTPRESGTEATLRSVVFLDEGATIAVGDGVVLRSVDSGETWTAAALPNGPSPELLAVGGSVNAAFAVGVGGVLLSSETDGATWVELPSPTTDDLIAIDGLGSLIVSRGGGLYIYDSVSWYRYSETGEEVIAVDADVRWLVTADNIVRHLREDNWPYITAEGSLPEGSEPSRVILRVDEERAMLLGEAGESLDAALETDSEEVRSQCVQRPFGAVEGRPFYVEGEARTAPVIDRDDWAANLTVDVESLSVETRETLAQAWARDGAYEHASVASFARFILELMAVGAPANLVADAQSALADEVLHARACFALASAYAGRARGPGRFALDGAFAGERDLVSLALATLHEGCINETIAAVEADVAHSLAEVPAVRQTLQVVAADEARHAELAWRTLTWALTIAGEPLRVVLGEALDELRRTSASVAASDDAKAAKSMARYGRLSPGARSRITARVRQVLIIPRLEALLGERAQPAVGCVVA